MINLVKLPTTALTMNYVRCNAMILCVGIIRSFSSSFHTKCVFNLIYFAPSQIVLQPQTLTSTRRRQFNLLTIHLSLVYTFLYTDTNSKQRRIYIYTTGKTHLIRNTNRSKGGEIGAQESTPYSIHHCQSHSTRFGQLSSVVACLPSANEIKGRREDPYNEIHAKSIS